MTAKARACASARAIWLVLTMFIGLWPVGARAQSDEIQVYTGDLAAPGVFNLTLHNNYTFSGGKTAAFPGGIVPARTLNGVPEWAYGVTDWFEAGLYFPLYSISSNRGGTFNGFKLRTLFAVPDAASRTFVYGVNFEFSYNSRHWDPTRSTLEIRPIVGWHLGKIDFFVNPILDYSYDGLKNLDFAPSVRLAYNLSDRWAFAVEDYSDFGPIHQFLPGDQQSHQLFLVGDYSGQPVDVEFGLGFGLTQASDDLVAKLILSRDLN